MSMKLLRRGFTLVEILIVVAIILLLSIIVLMNVRGQMARATDIRRKTDLDTLRKFFEDYNNDSGVFPAPSAVNDCGVAINPYITKIPCDPVSREHYGYFLSPSTGGYRICAKLSDTTDIAIVTMGCTGPAGCGLGGPPSGGAYNYCLASGVTASAVGTVDEISSGGTPTPGGGGTPTPTPNLNPDYHVTCSSGGACVYFSFPAYHGCRVTWELDCPGFIHKPAEIPFSGACNDPLNRCTE
jgi:general secretion pathway protein G